MSGPFGDGCPVGTRAANIHTHMKATHALGFVLFGTLFAMLPRYAPGLCVPDSFTGESARQLWLQFMSCVQLAIGGSYFVRAGLGFAAELLEYTPATEAVPALGAAATRVAPQGLPVPEPELLEIAPDWLAERGTA